ncbi:MAG TPA: signal recognition particle-docking protein FtsY [Gemmatimonadota bacterium]|nr:signal recognition particle-docking protein FtsY [Gemmatimonadota bacterium]
MSDARLDVGRKASLWQRIKDIALTDVGTLVRGIDEDTIAGLERALLEADLGVELALDLVDDLERAAQRGEVKTEEELRDLLAERLEAVLAGARGAPPGAPAGSDPEGDPGPGPAATAATDAGGEEGARPGQDLRWPDRGPCVVLLLGVNGTGKTTTAAKLARRASDEGRSVVLAACDTFRAAAREQLETWAGRVGARFVGGQQGGDPAAVAYDAVESAAERGDDLVIVDTAGRLHTKRNLLDELRKIDRVTDRLVEGAPHERLLVVDATSGQNVLLQAREFGRMVPLTGLVLAKTDSTARGGAAVAVAREVGVPVRFVGTGERPEDLELFDPASFVEGLLGAA